VANDVVADASAVLALVLGEGDTQRLTLAVRGAIISTVNLAEIAQKLTELGVDAPGIEALIWQLNLSIDAFDTYSAIRTGALCATHSTSGLSLADCACLSLAADRRVPVITTDRAWTKVDVGVEVVLIR
jgi:ribonuclease VapC